MPSRSARPLVPASGASPTTEVPASEAPAAPSTLTRPQRLMIAEELAADAAEHAGAVSMQPRKLTTAVFWCRECAFVYILGSILAL